MMHESVPFGNWEKRWHPLRREWVVYAAHRNSRPWNFEKKESDAGESAVLSVTESNSSLIGNLIG